MSTGPDSSQAPTRIRGPSIQDGHTATRAATANVHVEAQSIPVKGWCGFAVRTTMRSSGGLNHEF